MKGRLKNIEKDVPKDNMDFAKKVLTGVLTFPLRMFQGKLPK